MIKPIIDSMTVTPAGGSAVRGRSQATPQASNPSSTKTTTGPHNPESIFEPRDSQHAASTSTSHIRIPGPLIFQAKDVKQDVKTIRDAFKGHKDERRVSVVLNEMENLIIKGKKVTIKDDYVSCLGRYQNYIFIYMYVSVCCFVNK